MLTLLFGACATAPRVGVREDFAQVTVTSVAAAPLFATSQFGLDGARFASVRETYERAVAQDLRSLGFEVVTPDELHAQLEARGALDQLEDISTFRNGLSGYFEPRPGEREPREVLVLRALHADGALPASTLFVGEIAYQSAGVCTSDPREHNQLAQVFVGGKPARGDLAASPCVVSHFQAKLVDGETGRTMWQNRFLRELRVAEVTPDVLAENIAATVHTVILGEFGLGPFAPRRGAAVSRH